MTTDPIDAPPVADPWMVSVDDHVTEPPDVWTSRLPSHLVEEGPRVVEVDGAEHWVYGRKRKHVREQGARLFAPGSGKRDLRDDPVRYSEMRPGCYDPVARVRDMDVARVRASLCFPSFPRFCGQEFYEADDRDLALLCVRAYNDWMLDEWAASAPGRLVPMVIIPLWDPPEAAREIERCAAKGARAVAFPENPVPLGLPSIHDAGLYWDPVFAAAAACRMPLCMHIGSSSRLPQTSPDAPFMTISVLGPTNAQQTLVDWLFSGTWVRHPDLDICLSEGGIGWMPYILERADSVWERDGELARSGVVDRGRTGTTIVAGHRQAGAFDVRPSELFAAHVYGCFIDDVHGAASIEGIGVGNVMVESDYPHADTSWPRSSGRVAAALTHLDPADRALVLEGNARRVFRLDDDWLAAS